MKCPIPVYFIAGWCFLALATIASHLSRLIATWLSEGQASNQLSQTISGIGGFLIIWHVVRLIQLKSFNRWFSVIFFGWWTLTLTWNAIVLAPRIERPVRPVLVFLTFGLFNVASIWYLVRPRFREFAAQCVFEREREKHARMMQKISQKKIQSGL